MEIFSGWQGLNYNYWERFGSLWKWLGPIHNYFVKWKGRLELSKIEGVFFKKENRESVGGLLKEKGELHEAQGKVAPFLLPLDTGRTEEGEGGAGSLGPAALGAWGGHGGGGNRDEG